MSTPDTKEKLLDAAEELFAERGMAATSVRAIVSEAGANLAAVHYHFGSKEALVEAVFARRLGPLNRERVDLLGRYEEEARGNPVPLEKILRAFLAPPLCLSKDESRGGPSFTRVMGRTFSEPSEQLWSMIHRQFDEVKDRFVSALSKSLPHLGEKEVFLRLHFLVGTLAYILCMAPKLESMGACPAGRNSDEHLLDRLVPFMAAGFQSPATKPLELKK